MEQGQFITQLLACPGYKDQQNLLRSSISDLHQNDLDTLAEGLKEQVIQLLWSDTQAALNLADLLLDLADQTKDRSHQALGLRTKAQAVMLGMGEFQQALDLYDQAVAIYQDLGDQVGVADVNVTRIWALANLSSYTQAVEAAEDAAQVLQEYARWRSLATLHNNLATIHNRAGKSDLALEMHTRARDAFLMLGEEGEPFLGTSELNRAWDLYELAQYQDSIQASQEAITQAERFDQTTVIARANHNLGITYLRLGRSNEALQLLELARQVHLSNDQVHEAALCDLSRLDCLYELRRFKDILSTCQDIIPIFREKGMQLELAESVHGQAMAFLKLARYQEAIDCLQDARQIFIGEGNQLWASFTDLETASLLLTLGDPEGCKATSQKCIDDFDDQDHPVEGALARVVSARAAYALGEINLAEEWAGQALRVAEGQHIPFLTYQGNKLLSQVAQSQGDIHTALKHCEVAISALERISRTIMTEFHADFFEDKGSVYESAVDLSLRTGQPGLSLSYVERAKSRALWKILAFRPQLGIQAQQLDDEPLVAEINDLRQERERLLRKVQENKFGGRNDQYQEGITSLEAEVTVLWHKLLVRNAGYARQAATWQVHTEDPRPYLEAGILLLEYFAVGEQLLVFLLHQGGQVIAHHLPASYADVTRYLQLFTLNTYALTQTASANKVALIANAQALLKKLFHLLIEPVAEELFKFHQLVIVPHGVLHYLPFHALFDGERYLVERFSISYLPGSSFLSHYLETTSVGHGILSLGHSYHGLLPNAAREADRVAQLFGTEPLLDDDARMEDLQHLASGKNILHFACHGEFNPANPLFSGLALQDGWLTTLDVFNMRLPVSLVTLSACETGRSVVGGGDELLGIMRAFLSAGAASLVLSHWAVEDRSTWLLAENFYRSLVAGATKAEALQQSQKYLLTYRGSPPSAGQEDPTPYSHPYYWAPFFLVGDYGQL